MKMKNLTLTLSSALLLAAMPLHAQTKTFNYTGGFQTYTVTNTGWYLLDARGAQGGAQGFDTQTNNLHQGGKGARMQGYAYLTNGSVLRIAVGGMGQQGSNDGNNVSGGGGGGAADYDGAPGLTGPNGSDGDGGQNGNGGENGNGGFWGYPWNYYAGAGGAGFYGMARP